MFKTMFKGYQEQQVFMCVKYKHVHFQVNCKTRETKPKEEKWGSYITIYLLCVGLIGVNLLPVIVYRPPLLQSTKAWTSFDTVEFMI